MIAKANEINPQASKRELDMLLSMGEQISIALCAMAMEKRGLPVVSLTAWQVGIQTNNTYTDARIRKISKERIQAELDKRNIIIQMIATSEIRISVLVHKDDANRAIKVVHDKFFGNED